MDTQSLETGSESNLEKWTGPEIYSKSNLEISSISNIIRISAESFLISKHFQCILHNPAELCPDIPFCQYCTCHLHFADEINIKIKVKSDLDKIKLLKLLPMLSNILEANSLECEIEAYD